MDLFFRKLICGYCSGVRDPSLGKHHLAFGSGHACRLFWCIGGHYFWNAPQSVCLAPPCNRESLDFKFGWRFCLQTVWPTRLYLALQCFGRLWLYTRNAGHQNNAPARWRNCPDRHHRHGQSAFLGLCVCANPCFIRCFGFNEHFISVEKDSIFPSTHP